MSSLFSIFSFLPLAGPKGDPGSNATMQLGTNTAIKQAVLPVARSAVVSGGTAVFHFTDDKTANGNALWPNGPDLNSIQPIINDETNIFLYGWTWSNSNKTLTVKVNKLGVISLVTGLFGVNAANGATCTVIAWGN